MLQYYESVYVVGTLWAQLLPQFWTFTCVLIMVWKFAFAFYRILKLFSFIFFYIFNLDFLCMVPSL